jgi:hypothetical protein
VGVGHFLIDIEKINIDKRWFVTTLGYNPNFRVPGSIRVSLERVSRAIYPHNSVRTFLHSHDGASEVTSTVDPSDASTSERVRIENHDPEFPWLGDLRRRIEILKQDQNHQERAHESLVEIFFEAMAYEKFVDIKHRQGRIDISIEIGRQIRVVNEVKRDWGLTSDNSKVVEQAYIYAMRSGSRTVVITNGDYYAVYDRDNGRSIRENFMGEFRLTDLTHDDVDLLVWLNKATQEALG